ncbi:prepilin-type N-terminal cleavage/methylation domain-containing protein, partial [Yersinia pestis]
MNNTKGFTLLEVIIALTI